MEIKSDLRLKDSWTVVSNGKIAMVPEIDRIEWCSYAIALLGLSRENHVEYLWSAEPCTNSQLKCSNGVCT